MCWSNVVGQIGPTTGKGQPVCAHLHGNIQSGYVE